MVALHYSDDLVTLHHGNCLEVLRTLPDDSVDAVVTDPPFKLSQEYGTTTDPDNLLAVSSIWPVAVELLRVVRPGGICALFYDTRILPLALAAMRDARWKYLRALTLYRRWGNASLLHGWMTTSDFVLIFAKGGSRPTFYAEPAHDVYVRDRPESDATGHPAQKPLAHTRHLVRHVTPPQGVVLDPFMGSGTTGVAAVLEGRRFIGCELNEHYADVARRRTVTAQQGYRDDGSQGVLGVEVAS